MRLTEIIIIVGKKGAGKTTVARKLMQVNRKKCLVVDTFDHPSYQDIDTIQAHDLHRWAGGNARLWQGDPYENLVAISRQVYNALVVLEDAAKYIDPNMGKTIKPLFVDSKQHNLDMVIMFHRLAEIPVYLLSFVDKIVIHKTNENHARSSKKFANDTELLKTLERIQANPSPFYHEVITYN